LRSGRSDNIHDYLLSQFDVQDDAIVMSFATTKTSPDGYRHADNKLIYANPLKPEICMVTILGLHTWSTTRSLHESKTIMLTC
jgi:hypothetical protein